MGDKNGTSQRRAETVRQKIAHYGAEVPFGNLVTMLQFGTLPADLTRKNIETFAAEVMPHLRGTNESELAETATVKA